MQSNEKLPAGAAFPELNVARVGGGTVAPAAGSGKSPVRGTLV